MSIKVRTFGVATAGLLLGALTTEAGLYGIVPSQADVLPGTTIGLSAEVVTEAGDNVIGIGYFSFALDLTLSGTAGAVGEDISNLALNVASFDDLLGNSLGFAQGDQYLGVAGVTTDIIAPTFGHNVGDITWLFNFDLTIPATAQFGETITITPSEGALENLIASMSFDNVMPQTFEPTTLTVVPEPSSATLCLVIAAVAMLKRRRR